MGSPRFFCGYRQPEREPDNGWGCRCPGLRRKSGWNNASAMLA